MVTQLLEHGAEVSGPDVDGRTPLHHAAYHGHEDAVILLLSHGADLQSTTIAGRTAEDAANMRHNVQIAALIKEEAERREALRRTKCEAFAMGQLERLGAVSWVRGLDPGVVGMVLDNL